jgi:hypothetical protein
VSNFNQHWKFKTGTGRTSIEISLAYRPPSSGAENTEKLCDVLRTSVIIGDINMPRIDWDQLIADYRGRDLLRMMEEEEMTQLVSFSTHTKGGLLELFVTNCPDGIVSIRNEGHLRKMNHSIILFEAEDIPQSITEESTGLNWRKANMEEIRKEVDRIEWPKLFTGNLPVI